MEKQPKGVRETRHDGAQTARGAEHRGDRDAQQRQLECNARHGRRGPTHFTVCGPTHFTMPSSRPTFVKAATAKSRSDSSWAALICTRMRASPFGTTGKEKPIT